VLEIAYTTNKGIRDYNDDRLFVNGSVHSDTDGMYSEETCCLVAVCDGVGGEAYGWKAAELVAGQLVELSKTSINFETIDSFVKDTNELLVQEQQTNKEFRRMATTIASVYIDDNSFWAFNVGDSRIYKYRSPFVSQISLDHSLVKERERLGLTTYPGQEHVITRCFGGENSTPEIVDGTELVNIEDIFVLCSDGLWGCVDDIEIEEIIQSGINSKDICDKLYQAAVNNNSDDNISIIVIWRKN